MHGTDGQLLEGLAGVLGVQAELVGLAARSREGLDGLRERLTQYVELLVDDRPAETVSGFVEDSAGQSRVGHWNSRLEVLRRQGTVAGSEADQFDVGTVGQCPC